MKLVFLSATLIFFNISCVKTLPEQFSPNDVKQDQVFSIDEVTRLKCYIQTFEAIEPGSVISQAQKIILETNQQDSVVFGEKPLSVINNLPVVRYEAKGSPLCRTLLGQKEIRLEARPHSSYGVYFQVTGSHLRILMSGALHELPYQKLSQAFRIGGGQYVIPIGGYPLQQGKVQNVLNAVNQKTHILDFFPSEELLQDVQSPEGIPQKVRKEAEEIYIPELSSSFAAFKYRDKPDILPKSYFEGVWYSGVSIVSTKILSRNKLVGSGMVLSGNSYDNYFTPGQKISFQFEAGRLKAVNEYYKSQGDELNYPAIAEVLSIPIRHLDYGNTLEELSANRELEEPLSQNLSWKDKRYVSVNFSQVENFYSKRFKAAARRYLGDSLEGQGNASANGSSGVTVKEVLFASDYFDFVIDDGGMEYRISFFKKYSSKPSSYQPKTIAKTDPAFEFFRLQNNTIFPKPLESFQEDYENQIRILRVHPNEQGLVPLYFSKATPKDDLIRSIGRESVSLWNQALSKAGVSWRLYLDETKDVNVGDNRYHALNMPNEKDKLYSGLSQSYADDETGEVIATTSSVIIPDIQETLERMIIVYAYEKYELLHSVGQTAFSYPALEAGSFLFPPQEGASLSYSIENLRYLLFKNNIQPFLNPPAPPKAPQSMDEARSYFEKISQIRKSLTPKGPQFFPEHFENLSPSLRDWMRNFKMAYALKEGRFIENDSLEQVQNNVNKWGLEKFSYQGYSSKLDRILDAVCHDIENPVLNKANFKTSVEACVQKIYPIYALGVSVHELGHSLFSLRHNFSASADYSSFDDHDYQLKHLIPYLKYTNANGKTSRVDGKFSSKASSVMDYISFSDGEQWSPGAYDVAALKFLFSSERDDSEELGSVRKLFASSDQWLSSEKRQFKRCSDRDVGGSAYCLRFDSGSEPHEIALNEVKSLFHTMNQYFYNPGRFASDDRFYSYFFNRLWNLMVIYQDWRRRLDYYSRSYFNTTVERLSEEQRVELFSQFTTSAFVKSRKNAELFSFYKARNIIYHTLTYLAFLPNRYCVLEKNWSAYEKKRWKPENSYVLLELSKVIESTPLINEEQAHPLLSCWKSARQEEPHPAVAEYLSAHYPHYFLKKEIGHFLYSQDLPPSAPYKEVSGLPHKGVSTVRANAFAALTLTGAFFRTPLKNSTVFLSMMDEKDLQKGLERLLLARITQGVFYPVVDFFDSFSNSELEYLNPEKSAKNLFGFPAIRNGKPDRIFRDELIQPSQLASHYERHPQSRTDRHQKKFYQNFLEERSLISLFNYLYLQAYIFSGGDLRDSISEKRAEIFGDIRLEHSRTSNLLREKAIQLIKYRESPHLSSLYYFELNDFLILPRLDSSLDSVGNRILSELAKNSVRLLWTKPYRKSFEGEGLYTSGQNSSEGGFGAYLYEYLGNLLNQFQGTRLGRFYFIYAYLLSLGLLDGYEKAAALPHDGPPEELHQKAITSGSLLQRTVLNLFGFSFCHGPMAFENFYENLDSNTNMILEAGVKDGYEYNKWTPADSFQNASERVKYREDFEKWLFEVCSSDSLEKGKMHQLFLKEGHLLNRLRSFGLNNFVLGSPAVALPSFFRFLWKDRANLAEERFRNQMLSREAGNIENYLATKGGIAGIHTVINILFQFTFPPFFENHHLMKQWTQSNRQMLIDIIPKLMLMYSKDRRFVGEFMFLTSMIHNYCLDDQGGDLQRCHLVIEKIIGHYFRGSDYSSDPQIDFFFNGLFSGRLQTQNGVIPMRALITKTPKDYEDRHVNALAFDVEVLSDYLFYERGWDTSSAFMEELEAQKELLFNILPLSNFRILSSYNFALSNRMGVPMGHGPAAMAEIEAH